MRPENFHHLSLKILLISLILSKNFVSSYAGGSLSPLAQAAGVRSW